MSAKDDLIIGTPGFINLSVLPSTFHVNFSRFDPTHGNQNLKCKGKNESGNVKIICNECTEYPISSLEIGGTIILGKLTYKVDNLVLKKNHSCKGLFNNSEVLLACK